MKIDRRTLLKYAISAVAAPAANVLAQPIAARASANQPPTPITAEPPAPLGRVTMFGADMHAKPDSTSLIVRRVRRDEVVSLLRQVRGEAIRRHNDVWYETPDGFLYSPLIQPVRDERNDLSSDIAPNGYWGEITVPVSEARRSPDREARLSAKLYFGSVYRVIASEQGADGARWYRLQQGVTHTPGPWIPADNLRVFDPVKDLSPLSPDVTNKRIEVSIEAQTMTAYENDIAVLTTRVSTGIGKNFTPRGSYRVWRKAIGQRMIGGVGEDFYDLPGVPFPVYFTYRGIAFHGAYWHNDFGVVRSHGCVNMLSEHARWIWRWTTPAMNPGGSDVRFGNVGTPVRVI
jgi:hypothetical protein